MALQTFTMEEISNKLNLITFNNYFEKIKLMALNMFEWQGLPETCNPRFIELCLFGKGNAVFVKDELYGYLSIEVTPSGQMNMYQEPTSLHAYSTTGYNKNFKWNENAVLIRNNLLSIPTVNFVDEFAYRLANIERTIDMNLINLRQPYVILCDEKQKKSIEAMYKKVDGYYPRMFANDKFDNKVEVINIDTKFYVKDLQELKNSYWSEVLTFMGIDNANFEKKERLIIDEVNSNNEQIEFSADLMLKSRQTACKIINESFPDLSISVDFRKKRYEETEVLKDDNTDIENDD